MSKGSFFKKFVLSLFILTSFGTITSMGHAEDFEVEKASNTLPVPDDLSGKLAFVLESGIGRNKTSTLMITDITGDKPPSVIRSFRGGIKSLAGSFDGRTLIFTAGEPNTYPLIYTADVGSSNVQLVTPEKANHVGASISPDGSQILYSRSVGGNPDIYLASSGGGNPRRLTTSPAADTSPSWAPDGNSFIYSSDPSGNNRPRLFSYNLRTGTSQPISAGGGYATEGRYSPDGKKIAFTTMSQGSIATLGGSAHTVSNIAEAPTFSPNSQNIAYSQGNAIVLVLASGKTMAINPLAKSNIKGKILKPVWLKAQ